MIGWFKKNVVQPARQTFEFWGEDDGGLMAAAVSYYAALSLFPMFLILISGLGFFLEFTARGQSAEQQILNTVAQAGSPQLRDQVHDAFTQVRDKKGVSGPIGAVTLLFTAMVMFAQFERAFDRIWNVTDPKTKGFLKSVKNILFHRLRAFLMLLGVGALVIVVFIAGMSISIVSAATDEVLPLPDVVWKLVQTVVGVVLNAVLFTVVYRTLSKGKVSWREALQGGLVAAVVWEIGRVILANVLVGTRYSSAYGVVGSFIAVMLWVYYANTVLFLGAEYIQTICRRCNQELEPEIQQDVDEEGRHVEMTP